MGYRSEVLFAIDKKVVPLFIAHIASNTAAQTLCFKYSDEHTKDYLGEGHWLFRWDHIKWYGSYPEIQAIMSFVGEKLQELPESFEQAEEYYRLVILGEEVEDIKDEGWGFDTICISRGIDY
tara:strand:+ start:597 stop:962 length:366 start_codon:yes stop_codon:yes gene_type:complete